MVLEVPELTYAAGIPRPTVDKEFHAKIPILDRHQQQMKVFRATNDLELSATRQGNLGASVTAADAGVHKALYQDSVYRSPAGILLRSYSV